ncbi:hypothetical protein C8034_v002272 [Colletotrichum sidae]|uniref:F-box domain-containing protein n=1 Tax=Colletotrichum sidae TaxID=1347389 RepID=A0A4V3I2H8_9PEZI|nr:hypothetical protein C8034_v002272 [Colletotrichum sidae]
MSQAVNEPPTHIQRGLLKLPDETLLQILDLPGSPSHTRREHAARLRLTCRRLRDVSSHWLVERTTVDMSRPETLRRFCGIAQNSAVARGVREVRLRLHYYHPWAASSIGNFTAAALAEWKARLRYDGSSDHWRGQFPLDVTDMMNFFVRKLDKELGNDDAPLANALEISSAGAMPAVEEAYAAYKAGFDAQDAAMRDGLFLASFTEAFAALPDWYTHTLTLFDCNTEDDEPAPWRYAQADKEDTAGQQQAVVRVLSRPMLWEDARWIGSGDDIWRHVPVDMMIDVLVAMGQHDKAKVGHLRLLLTPAPDYNRLATDIERLRQLTDSVKALDIFQFVFKPHSFKDLQEPTMALSTKRFAEEMHVINRYLGAIAGAKTLGSFEVDFGQFCYSRGLSLDERKSPAPFGANFDWLPSEALGVVALGRAALALDDFRNIARSLPEESCIDLYSVDLFDFLARGARRPQSGV